MFYSILDTTRKALLPLLAAFQKEGFYLAGGTGLALQIGHRDSVDFDFFRGGSFDTNKLFEKARTIFAGHDLEKIQDADQTLSLLVDKTVRISFFSYPYKLIENSSRDDYFIFASIADIGCMKLSSITGRASNKDYVDIYFILHNIRLAELLEKIKVKFPELNNANILKGLVYFDDVTQEPLKFTEGYEVDFDTVKTYLEGEVKKYYQGILA